MHNFLKTFTHEYSILIKFIFCRFYYKCFIIYFSDSLFLYFFLINAHKSYWFMVFFFIETCFEDYNKFLCKNNDFEKKNMFLSEKKTWIKGSLEFLQIFILIVSYFYPINPVANKNNI
jgi:hypothetical protein